MTENRDTMEIDLRELFGVLMRRIWSIILAALLCASAAFAYTFFLIDPLYQANALLYVNNSNISVGSSSLSITTGDLSAAQKLVSTYVVILKSRTVLNEVIETAGLNRSYSSLAGMISASAVDNTEVFRIVVTSTDPAEAELIANTIAEILPEKIPEIVNGSDVRVVDYAVVPSQRSSPSYTRNTAIGALVGAVLCAGIILLAYFFDEVIHSEDYLAQTYPEIPLLAVIPNMHPSKQRGGYGYGYGSKYGYRYGGKYGYRYGSKYGYRSYGEKSGAAGTVPSRNAKKEG